MARSLTKQDKGFVKDIIDTGNGTQAVMDNYGITDANYAGVKAHRLLSKAKIQDAIKSIAERIPDDLLEQVHLDGLQASTQVMKDGDVSEKPDYAVRHKYLDSAYKLKGSYAPEKSTALNVTVGLNNLPNSELNALREEFEKKLKDKLVQ